MEVVVAILRPKLNFTVSQDFHAKAYDILLTESSSSSSGKTQHQLLTTSILCDDEPVDALCNYVYEATGAEFGGLKGKRAVFVPPSHNEPTDDQETIVKGVLYCIPVDSKDKLNSPVVEHLPGLPGFYSLDLVLEQINDTNPLSYSKQTRIMLIRLESWLKEKHSVPGAIYLLFSVCTEDRLKRSLTNPAYLSDVHSGLNSRHLEEEEVSRTLANEMLAKLMAIEKCDITVINPLVDADIAYKPKVDAVAINKYWGLGKPEYSRIRTSSGCRSACLVNGDYNWMDEFPLHKCAHIGDAEGIREYIKRGLSVSIKDKTSWTPIHYTAWFGHLEAMTVLLNQGDCPPNIRNDCGSTPLHLAATQGHVYVVELLLNHHEIDVNAVDINNKTALDLCENVDRRDCQDCAKLLRAALTKPPPVIQVCLMDGTYRSLKLVSGANTTVQQLHGQMLRELNIPETYSHIFALWICSRNLQLQLKPDHKPIQHLNDWKRKIVTLLTTFEPSHEDPQLFWRRNAILNLVDEQKVRNPAAINLLFHEAYHLYIKSMYPCSADDALVAAGILMQLRQGDYDARRAKTYITSTLTSLIPLTNLSDNKKTDWINKIQAQYKSFSQQLRNKEWSPPALQIKFLHICWCLRVYGSAFFTGEILIKASHKPTPVFIGVNDLGVHIIDVDKKRMLQSFDYTGIEWSYKKTNILEIKQKTSSKGGMHIFTKQAELIGQVMSKLAQLNTSSATNAGIT